MAGWDDVSSPVQQQPANQWDSVSTPIATPKIPDTSGVQQMAKDNIAANDNTGEEAKPKPPQTASQQLDAAAGMPVSNVLKGGNAPLTSAMRGHLVDSYKAGTATDAGGFMQNILPAIGDVIRTGGSEIGKMEIHLLTSTPRSLASDVVQNTINLPVQGLTRLLGRGYQLAGGEMSVPTAETLTQGIPEFGGFKGQKELREALQEKVEHKPTTAAGEVTQATLGIAPYLAGGEGSALRKGIGALASGGGTVAGAEVAKEAGFGEKGQQVGRILGGASGMIYGGTSGHEALKEPVAEALGKDPKDVTPTDIDQTIAKSFAKSAPAAADFHMVSQAMDSNSDTLHEIYRETGVHPDRVFEDARNNPEIAKAVAEGKIPEAYDHLRDTRPPIPEDIQKIMDNYKSEPEEPLPTSKEYAQDLYNRLHEKLGQDTATDIQSMQRELKTKDALGKELDEKFYLKKEDERLKLTEEESKLYNEHIQPLADQERALYEKARELGSEEAEPVSESYVHRIVKGKGHYLDRLANEFGEDENIGFGKPQRGISQSTSALKEAEFHALQDEEGNRKLQMGKIPQGYKAGDKYTDKNGKEWTIKRAKTEEIEQNTELKYYKSAIGNTEDNIRRLEKTIRNIEFLNDLKADMEKTGFGIPPNITEHPLNYQHVSVPQLRGWSFDPRVAEVLNDIYDRGGESLMGKLNNFLIKGMFLNPIPHIQNVFYDYLASRGWQSARLIKGADCIMQGIRDVKEFSPEYIDALKNGAALRLPAIWKTEFYNQIQRQFLKEMQGTKEGLDLAKSWGFDSVPAMAESVYNATQKALWGSGDAFLMAKIRELKAGGMQTKDAIEEAQKHIVDYRIPPRVGEKVLGPELSRLTSKALQRNDVVVFTRYHYGLFKSLGSMVKDALTLTDPKTALNGAGQLFATYLLLTVVNPLIAQMASSVMGEKEKIRRPGVAGLMGAIEDLSAGKKGLGDALSSQFIASPAIQLAADIKQDKVVNPELGHEGVQLMDYLMKQPTMAIPAIPYNIREGKQSAGEEALRQMGVTPDKEFKKRKPSSRAKKKLEQEEQALLGE